MAHISVVDEKGNPQGRNARTDLRRRGLRKIPAGPQHREPKGPFASLTLPDGKVSIRLAYQSGFTAGNRQVTFVIREESDPTTTASGLSDVRSAPESRSGWIFTLERPATPEVPAGTLLEMFDENNGQTLRKRRLHRCRAQFRRGKPLFVRRRRGRRRAGGASRHWKLDGFKSKIPVQLQHGYFVCKDISLMEFPSGEVGDSRHVGSMRRSMWRSGSPAESKTSRQKDPLCSSETRRQRDSRSGGRSST